MYRRPSNLLLLVLMMALPFARQVSADGQCPETSRAIDALSRCIEEESSGTVTLTDFINLKNETAKKELFTKSIVCYLKKFEILNDEMILDKEAVMKSVELYDIDEQRTEKLLKGYEACFTGFQGTKNETWKVLECISMINDWACEKPKKCKAKSEQPKNDCKLTNETLQTILDCNEKTQNTNGRKLCFLLKTKMVDSNLELNKEGVLDYYARNTLSDNPTVQEKIDRVVNACLDKYDDETDSTEKTKNSLHCVFEDTKKVCEGTDDSGLISDPEPTQERVPKVIDPEDAIEPDVPRSMDE